MSDLPSESKEKSSAYPFDIDEDDHCETPLEAFQNLDPYLSQVAAMLGKTKETLVIYGSCKYF